MVYLGYLCLFKFVLECGDFLVVGVVGDYVFGVLLLVQLCFDGIIVISFVDYVFVMIFVLEDIICVFKFSIVVKGDEYEFKFNFEQVVVDEYGGKFMFSLGEMCFFLIDLFKCDIFEFNLLFIVLFNDYLECYVFMMYDLCSMVEKFKGLWVVVLGDLIVDEYVSCEVLGMLQEDLILVVIFIMQECFIGGVGIVVLYVCKFGV